MTRSKTPLVLVLVAVLVVAALLGGELFFRQQIKSCLAGQLESEIGSQVDVGLGWKPILISLIDKQVSSVTLDSDDARFGPAEGMTVHAEVNDVNVQQSADSNGTIGSSSADIDWSTAGIASTLQSQGIGALVTGVTSDASAGTLSFAVGGLAELTVKPVVAGGSVDVQTVGASILGLGIPTDLVDSIVGVLSDSLQQYPLDMAPTALTVTDSGIELTLQGDQYTLPPVSADQTQQTPEGCSLIA
ncbi:DUF2993 domain-containing protein [Rhodococcus sp. H36-A4]|uniref:LmeA family phospholipid-binding protein n=1 Tax=unclassified Rhodococcus (in: high G+C Gram-positive bacteria) TaxID=192944 RepID=UPI0022B03F3E|nr:MULTISPECIES: DUF2993 domain-containing protein [unclassified Rhodococcus (in: high G+C Gram-positive bacteria)]MCZ4079225.1 DUF2993 domain-containing protein [Rhodococcus sp. H36-A4]MDJ0358984.1 DUF2993 domain-containing protein [Rhodococcus sp. H29-C3]